LSIGDLETIQSGLPPLFFLSSSPSGKRGLLGITFDPNFASNGYVYVYYTTANAPIHSRVSRFAANGDVAASGSEEVNRSRSAPRRLQRNRNMQCARHIGFA
jgi:hypothetical protein